MKIEFITFKNAMSWITNHAINSEHVQQLHAELISNLLDTGLYYLYAVATDNRISLPIAATS